MNLLHQATVISTSLVRLVATIYSDILNVTQKTGYRFDSFEILMLNVKLSDKQNKSVLSLALATVYRPPGPYTDFLKEFADFLSDLLVNVDKALIVGDFNIHVYNTNDAFTDLINFFGVKQNVTGPTHFNHTLDLIISHGIDITDIAIVPQSDDVTDHFLVSCMLHITDINYMAPRYRPGRIIIPATKDRFTNNLPDLSQLLCVPINTDELDTITMAKCIELLPCDWLISNLCYQAIEQVYLIKWPVSVYSGLSCLPHIIFY